MVVIGLGSNVGARGEMLDLAVGKLAGLLAEMRVSQRLESKALLMPDSPPEWDIPFLNMAVAGECSLSPQALLSELKYIEQKMGRMDRGRWAPREIDLDILAYHDVVLSEAQLTIPHPELLSRHFALAPLAEIAPGWQYPLAGPYYAKTARALLAELFP